ncbi:MAG: pyrroline-5-carboxylate reductase [Desulfobacterales bacterium]|nr:MAG: pyrroline-5-carboxylate reductase [Desulfobacterales bacterium]
MTRSIDDASDAFAALRASGIGFIGAGNMAEAMIRGILPALTDSGLLPEALIASDISAGRREYMAATYGIHMTAETEDVFRRAHTIILAVKPRTAPALFPLFHRMADSDHLLISIMAGVSLSTMIKGIGDAPRIIRTMPNTPIFAGAGAVAIADDGAASPEDLRVVETIFSPVARTFRVPESLLNAVTGLSGSGPAYIFMVIEALADGGVNMGLPRDLARTLAAQTVMGAAKMVLESGRHPGELKDMVTSPGGTTIAAVHSLESGGLRSLMMDAVEAAARKGMKLDPQD